MQKWEYKVVKRADVSEEQLNGFGAEGWELMNFVLPHANIPGSFDEIEVELVSQHHKSSWTVFNMTVDDDRLIFPKLME